MQERKRYQKPQLSCLGTVQDLTQNGGLPNSDIPQGPNNTANKPGTS